MTQQPNTKKNTFPKNEKLKKKKVIEQVFNQQKHLFKYPFKLVYLGEKNKNPPKVLISVSKRGFKHAVDRNLLKRRIKEGYRLNKYILEKNFAPPQNRTSEQYAENQKPENQTIEKDLFFICEYVAWVYVAKEILPSKEIHKKMVFLMKNLRNIS